MNNFILFNIIIIEAKKPAHQVSLEDEHQQSMEKHSFVVPVEEEKKLEDDSLMKNEVQQSNTVENEKSKHSEMSSRSQREQSSTEKQPDRTISSKPKIETASSARYTEFANCYFDSIVNKVMDDYTEHVHETSRNNESEVGVESSKEGEYQDHSIEKRIDDSSVDKSREESSVHVDPNESSSTIKNLANDYVSNMIDGLS